MMKERLSLFALLAAVTLVLVAVPPTAVAQVLPDPGDPPEPCSTVQCPNPCQDLGLCCSPQSCVEDIIGDVEDLVWWLKNFIEDQVPNCQPATECVPDGPVIKDPCGGQQVEDCANDPGEDVKDLVEQVCSAREPDLPGGVPEASSVQGSAYWSIGAVVHDPCGHRIAATPAIPAATDTGSMSPPVTFDDTSADTNCQKEGDAYDYDITITASLQDSTYAGSLPWGLEASGVTFDIPDVSEDFRKWGGGQTAALCEAAMNSDRIEACRESRNWAIDTIAASAPFSATGGIAYVPMADGTYLITVDGAGQGTAEYGLTTCGSEGLVPSVLTWEFSVVLEERVNGIVERRLIGSGESRALSPTN